MGKATNFYEKFESFCNELDSIYNINCGGCCFIAYLIAKELRKRNINYKLVIYSNFKIQAPKIAVRDSINNCNKAYSGCNHYAIKVDNKYLNNGDIECSSVYKKEIGCIYPDRIYTLYKIGDWNYVYNRSNNRKMSTIIHNFFNTYLPI